MSIEELKRRVDEIIAVGDKDEEAAHIAEDVLMKQWVHRHASRDALQEFQRLWDADFPRWWS